VLFWGSKDVYSNWYIGAPFTVEGITFNCVEQFFMYHKAMLFHDIDTANKILKEPEPREQKKLGRKIVGYDEDKWTDRRFRVMTVGKFEQFIQNPDLEKRLFEETGNKIIVEASPSDKIWGIGMDENNVNATDPSKWLGQNLLGMAIMAVRSRLLDYNKQGIK